MSASALDLHRLKQAQLASLLKLTSRQVRNLVEQGMPSAVGQDGKPLYDGPDCITWYLERKLSEVRADTEKPDEWDATARLNTAKAKMAELDLAVRQGRLLDIDYLTGQWSATLERLLATLATVPSRWAPKLLGAKTVVEMQGRLRPVERELRAALSRLGADPALDGEDDRAA